MRITPFSGWAVAAVGILLFARACEAGEKPAAAVSAAEGRLFATRPEEMLAVGQTKYYHSSTFVELEGGRILQAAGTKFLTSDDGGLTWSAPFSRADKEGKSVGGAATSLVRLSGKGVGLAAVKIDPPAPDADRPRQYLLFWRSADGGQSWEAPVQVTPPGVNTNALQDVLLRTSTGRIILPVYLMIGQGTGPNNTPPPSTGKLVGGQWVSTGDHAYDAHFYAAYVCYSDDDGRTWRRNQDGELTILQQWDGLQAITCEPSVAELGPRRLLMLMRTRLGRLFQSWSKDNGETWTRPRPTGLAASDAPAQLRTLPGGHLLVVWNQESEEEIKQGLNRTRLSAAVSRNGGGAWEFFQNVESMHADTRVEPGPIRWVGPAETYFDADLPVPVREREHVRPAQFMGRWAYPSVFVWKDRVLIAHTYSIYEEHPSRAEMLLSRDQPGGFNQKLKVFPLTWFYGGKQPAENPWLPRKPKAAQP